MDLIRAEDHKISRATVYRTLQWMLEAGIARKVDFGEGHFRFEHSYRHPRHFHLICKQCNRLAEFLSSDIEGLIELNKPRGPGEVVFEKERDEGLMHEPRFQAEALSEACGVPTLRLDHAARVGQPNRPASLASSTRSAWAVIRVSHQWMSASCAARRSATCLRSWSVMACPYPPADAVQPPYWLPDARETLAHDVPQAAPRDAPHLREFLDGPEGARPSPDDLLRPGRADVDDPLGGPNPGWGW